MIRLGVHCAWRFVYDYFKMANIYVKFFENMY
jgi:hypothetical protein